MAVFNFPYHKVSHRYPESSFVAQLGNSYQYSAAPTAPDQRIFTLYFALMKWFVTPQGQLDKAAFPEINLALLEDFYNTHKRHYTFTYPHPIFGELSCRFNKALMIPAGVTDGQGIVQSIELEFIEVPGLTASAATSLTQVTYTPLVP